VWAALHLLIALLLGASVLAQDHGHDHATLPVPPPDQDPGVTTLDGRKRAQTERLAASTVFHGFRFEDRLPGSGIGFRHQIVDDAGYDYKPVHYDHGNGIAVADVDGDGRLDLYFTTQLGRNELWRNLGGGRFEDVTGPAGVALEERVSVAASFADIDNDGDADLYVTTVKMGNVLFSNDGNGRFSDVSEQAGLGHVGHSSAAVFFDYDRDGLIDLFLTNVGVYTGDERGRGGYFVGYADAFKGHLVPERTERSILFENLGGGRFEDVSEKVGLVDESWSGDAAFADLTGDAFPDLYVLNMQGDDHYYEGRGGTGFVDRTAELFPRTPWGAMGIEFLDFDNDGRLDLYLTDMHSDMVENVVPGREGEKSSVEGARQAYTDIDNNVLGNAFFHNLGEGRFVEVSDAIGAENYWPWGISVDDLNADGYEDVFVAASMNYPYRYSVNPLLLNDRGEQFHRSEMVLGIEPRRAGRTHTEWFTLDCSAADRERPLCEGQQGDVKVMGTLGTRSAVIFDLDDDGDLDIVTNEFNSEPQVLVSNLSEMKAVRFLKVRPVGRASNRDGLGALVTVSVAGRRLTKQHDGKSGYLSQSRLPLYFGLGDAGAVDSVHVRWPSGREQTVSAPIEIDGLLEIVEPDSEG
jgi:hypothetical protein